MVFGFFKKKNKEEVPEKDSKTTRVGTKAGTDWIAQTKKEGLDSSSDSNVSAFDPNMPLPEGVAREDARRWKKLLDCLDEHPSFKIMTFDGLCWVDPFTANLVQAPFEMRETVEAHLAKNQFWKSAKLRNAGSLRLLVWEKYLAENLESDQRFHLFETDELWWNPWTKKTVAGITVKIFTDDRRRFSRLIAEDLAKNEQANPHKIESLDKLKRIMQGLEPEEAKETQRQGITGLGTSAAPRAQGGVATGQHSAATAGQQGMATGATTAPIAYQGPAGVRVPAAHGNEEPVIIGDESFAASLAGAVLAQGQIAGMAPVGTAPVVQGQMPSGGPIVLSGLPMAQGVVGAGPANQNASTIAGVTGVLGPALSVMPGIISLRDSPLGDSEDSRSLPGGIPMMRQGDLSADIIQKLVDSLQRISLVASSSATYQPATKSGAGSSALVRNDSDTKKGKAQDSMDDLFPDDAVSGEDAEEPKKSTETDVSTDSFADKQSKLDVDRAFARLQAREARTQQSEDPSGEVSSSEEGIGVDAGLNDDGFLEEEAEAVVAPELPEDEEKSDPVDDSAEDMEKARSVQNHLLGGIPQIPGIEIGMVYEPVTQLGGDFYFVHKIDDDRFFFMLGDVSGHGVQAALIVSSAVNTLRIMMHERQNWDLTDILCEMNDYMRQCLMSGQFFTAFTGIMTLGATPVLQCVCAGHHPAVRLRPGAADDALLEVGSKAMAIGLVRSTMLRPQIKVASFPLTKGDSIAVYTDGFIEAHDENGEELGHTFIHSSLVSHLDEPMNAFITKVVEDVRAEAKLIDDDLTLMILRLDR